MNNQADIFSNFDSFVEEVSKALVKAGELAREEAIRTNTGIVVSENGKTITISAAELIAQKFSKSSNPEESSDKVQHTHFNL